MLLERLSLEPKGSKSYKYEKTIICNEKAKSYASKGNEGLGSRDPHTCCLCQKVLVNRASLKNHFEDVHCKANKLSCDLCPKIFFSKKAIVNHMKVHSKKNFSCNICDYKTANKSRFKMHRLTHGDKVECPICRKRVSLLSRHHSKVHRPKKSCPVCQKMLQGHQIKRHMKTHSTVLRCEICEERFVCREALRRRVSY